MQLSWRLQRPSFLERKNIIVAKLGTTLELAEAPQLHSFSKKRKQTSRHFSEPALFRSGVGFLFQLTGNGEIERSN